MAKGIGLQQLMSKCDKVERELKSLRFLIKRIKDLPPDDAEKENCSQLIAFYCEKWKERYKHNPNIKGRNAGILKTMFKDYKLDESKLLIEAYLKMNDAFFIKKRHDPATMMSNIIAIGHFASSGAVITQEDARQTERTYKAQSLFDMVDQGKL